MRQRHLFPLPPTKAENERDKKLLLGVLRRVAAPAISQKTGLSRRQIKLLMRPLPKITVPR